MLIIERRPGIVNPGDGCKSGEVWYNGDNDRQGGSRMAHMVEFPAPGGDRRQALRSELEQVRREIAALDLEEPEDMESEAYEAWGDRHEALEDRADDLMDALEALEEP